MARGDMDWLPVWWSEGWTVTSSVTPSNPIRLSLFTATGVGINAGDVTIHRVVGASCFILTTITGQLPPWPHHERLEAPVQLNAAAGGQLPTGGWNSPSDFDSAKLPTVMWHRVWTPGGSGVASGVASAQMSGSTSHPWWSHIDVRVKRRLNAEEGLVYSVAPMGSSADSTPVVTLQWGLWLRALIEWKA